MQEITIRQATIDDAPFVTLVMMEAVGLKLMEEGKEPENRLIEICRRTDTLYTYRNCVIAECEGKMIGGLISYVGKGYHEVKMHTFGLLDDFLPFDYKAMDDEARDGEYYLDSIAVIPEMRGRGIARRLIEYGVEIAAANNLLPVLACDPENRNAYKLYTSIGFGEDGRLFIFGGDYLRMAKSRF